MLVIRSRDRLEVAGVDNVPVVSSIQFDSAELCDEWMKSIQRNIASQNALSVRPSVSLSLSLSLSVCLSLFGAY